MCTVSHKKSSLTIEMPGFFTTIQDAARKGFQQFGMPVAGVMDYESYILGQALVGNDTEEGALECTMLPPTIKVEAPCIVAFTGADMAPSINGIIVPRYIPFACQEGDIISGSYTQCGMRMYISFSGGIDVPSINGSVSTHTKAHIGGLEGRALVKGDTLFLKNTVSKPVEILSCAYMYHHQDLYNLVLRNRGGQYIERTYRVVLGPQADGFTTKGIKTLCTSPYILTPNSDRMGFRLEGAKIEHKESADIISDGAVFGSIQVPSDGQPIILMADRQTTGGYTKIGTVITRDLVRLSQATIGQSIQFEIITVEESQRIYREYRAKLDEQIKVAKQQSPYVFTCM